MTYSTWAVSSAQESIFGITRSPIRAGYKETHWMWFIFPQLDGLGFSEMSKRYAIKSIEEARHYLSHPILGPRLRECAQAVLTVEGLSARYWPRMT